MKLAIYGKGGIGKSTLSANLSAALAHCGKKVLQIGCDPKHDSTRLLLGGRSIVTTMDYMKTTPVALQRLDRVLHTGYKGVVCTEAGGPEPGVGCAGRGILSTFAMFDRLGLNMDAFDVVLYDVLGDVVCGGFAVPLRRDFADRVYVVTSEEFMALYAANNILKGVKNFDDAGHRLAGIILNSRGADEDMRPVERFSRRVGLPLIRKVPRSDRFRRAEMMKKTVVEAFPDSSEARLFHAMAREILTTGTVYPARFLNENALEREIFKGAAAGSTEPLTDPDRETAKETVQQPGEDAGDTGPPSPSGNNKAPVFLSKSLLAREPLHGCAFSGAMATTTQIRDTVTVAHGPRSCTHIAAQAILSAGLGLYARKNILLAPQAAPRVVSSDMDESMVIYGGNEQLSDTLEQAVASNPRAVFLITSCPSGGIGDNPLAAVEKIRKISPVPVIPVTSDGNLRGDYMQGVINACMEGAAALIDPGVEPEPDCVNILAEKNIAYNAESNFNTVEGLLKGMGIRVNCRFVRQTSADRLKHFLKGTLNLPAYTDYLGRLMADFVETRFKVPTAKTQFPVGFSETVAWIREIARFFHKQSPAEALIDRHRRDYREKIAVYRPALEGRRLMIITYVHNVDWMVEAAFDLGMEVAKVCILNYSQDNQFITRYPGRFEVETDYDPLKRDQDILRLKPDLLLGNYTPGNLPIDLHADIIPMCPDIGFFGGLAFARRWATLLKSPLVEGWKKDA